MTPARRAAETAKLAPLDVRIKGLLRHGDAMSCEFIAAGSPETVDEVKAEVVKMLDNGVLERDWKWRSVIEYRLVRK